MRVLLAYLAVLVAAATPWLEVLLVVPAGIVAGLSPAPVIVVAAVGNVATLVPAVYGSDRVRQWWRQRRGQRVLAATPAVDAPGDGVQPPAEDRGARRRARHLFDRYGLPGLAVLGPLVTGIHVAAVAAIAAGADRRRTLTWLAGGVAVWSALAGLLTVLGIEAFVDPDALPDVFGAVR